MRCGVRRHLLFALVLLAAGCASIPEGPETPKQAAERRSHAPRPAYNLAGYPPATRDGYIDGCESARHSEYARKNEGRMVSDPQYAMGWNDGFSICSR
jgi:hypothetical protein